MKKKVTVTFDIEVEIEDSKLEETLKGFREIIAENADIEDVMYQIAWNEVKFGDFCEGVGENGIDFTAKVVYTNTYIDS